MFAHAQCKWKGCFGSLAKVILEKIVLENVSLQVGKSPFGKKSFLEVGGPNGLP